MVENLSDFLFDNVEGTPQEISKEWFDNSCYYNKRDSSTHYSDYVPLDQKELLGKFGWLDENGEIKKLTYNTYDYGFRTPLRDKPSAVFIGCSNTFGTGLNIEQTFSYKLSQKLNLPLVNLGIPGASFDQTYRVLKTFLPKLNPKYVFCLIPDAARAEVCITPILGRTSKEYKGRVDTILKNINLHTYEKKENSFSPLVDYVKYIQEGTLITTENQLINYNKNLDALKYLCRKTKLFTIPTLRYFILREQLTFKRPYGRARDLSHFGETWHDIVTEDFFNLISQDKVA